MNLLAELEKNTIRECTHCACYENVRSLITSAREELRRKLCTHWENDYNTDPCLDIDKNACISCQKINEVLGEPK